MTRTPCTCPTNTSEIVHRTLEDVPYYCPTHAPDGSTSSPDPFAAGLREALEKQTSDDPPAPSSTPANPTGDVALNSVELERSLAAVLGIPTHNPNH